MSRSGDARTLRIAVRTVRTVRRSSALNGRMPRNVATLCRSGGDWTGLRPTLLATDKYPLSPAGTQSTNCKSAPAASTATGSLSHFRIVRPDRENRGLALQGLELHCNCHRAVAAYVVTRTPVAHPAYSNREQRHAKGASFHQTQSLEESLGEETIRLRE